MNLESLRKYCLSLPAVTEKIQWGADLVFKVGEKMFLVANTEAAGGHGHRFSFKCSDERFHELLEREGVSPAPYLARAKWVAVDSYDTLEPTLLRECVRAAYDEVFAKLPKKTREKLGKTAKKNSIPTKPKTARKKTSSRK